MAPTFFPTAALFRGWLERHAATATELLVGFWKIDSGQPSMTWPQSVDEALCFGWIDGVRKRIDDVSYTIRFTPRRPGSIWSGVNIAKMAELEVAGRLTDAGRRAFAARTERKSVTYAYEQRQELALTADELALLQAHAVAWTFFARQAPSWRHKVTWWVLSAKQASTRSKRLEQLIAACGEGRKL
jgi:uncharacterized protein YdeI (YjbR/CyaY-like superfamily)